MSEYDMVLRLALACSLGAIIGLERESLARPEGLRTYTLVCMGSALAMIVSMEIYYQFHSSVTADPGRIAAQVISGIGFLGAGSILREGANVTGLTTAAGLWVVACVGLACGAGLYLAAVATTGFILLILVYFFKVEERFSGMREYKHFTVVVLDRPGAIGKVGTALGEDGIHIKNLTLSHSEEDHLVLDLLLRIPPFIKPKVVADKLYGVSGVFKVDHQD